MVLLENVAGFLTSNNGDDFRDALIALNRLGYAVDAFIVDAVRFVTEPSTPFCGRHEKQKHFGFK